MLYNFLEIDIGLTAIDNLTARRGRWLVVYDKTNKVNEIMCQSWQVNKNNHGKSQYVDIDKRYIDVAEHVWHYLIHAVTAIRRKKYWRAVGEMDLARNMLIELLGYKYSLETKRFRDVDEFPEKAKNVLGRTLAVNLSQADLSRSLYALINAVYEELDEFFENSDYVIKVGKDDVFAYFSDVLGNIAKS